MVTLPILTFDEPDFSEVRIDESGVLREFWNKKGLAFGNSLAESLFEIDNKLASDSDKTPTPDWALEDIFSGKKEKSFGPSQLNEQASPRCYCSTLLHNQLG